jgi:hypothetical protein
MAYGEHIAGIKGSATLTAAEWHDGELDVGFDVQLVTAPGDPMTFVEHASRLHLDVPAEVADGGVVAWSDREVGDLAERARVDLVVRFRPDSAEFFTAAQVTTTPTRIAPGRVAMTHNGHVRFDPATWAGGAPLWPGIWDFCLRISTCGFEKEIRLGASRTPAAAVAVIRPQLSDAAGTIVRPYWTTPHDNLSVTVGPIRNVPAPTLAVGPDHVELGPSGLPVLRLPFDVRTTSIDTLTLRLANAVTGQVIKMKVGDHAGSAVAAVAAVARRRPKTGLWRISLAVAGRVVPTESILLVPVIGRNTILHRDQPPSAQAKIAAAYSRVRHLIGRRSKGPRRGRTK